MGEGSLVPSTAETACGASSTRNSGSLRSRLAAALAALIVRMPLTRQLSVLFGGFSFYILTSLRMYFLRFLFYSYLYAAMTGVLYGLSTPPFGFSVLLLPLDAPWEVMREALDEFEPGFEMEREQPAQQTRPDWPE